ncbi:hypothetical protein T11_7330 [Trichinella zimbabwensis]|uniref:Uncharacterized protein n=1 Tax=Trichinella zimbabwensis TaxID=268475 RepID=A0A0V1GIW1_9BILA|nr:hypothetical protein T11_10201 [Trichinella zimbabwensis]KRY99901.1 hypothetical protein T11_7330 [Trichinella zimbabwensis]
MAVRIRSVKPKRSLKHHCDTNIHYTTSSEN